MVDNLSVNCLVMWGFMRDSMSCLVMNWLFVSGNMSWFCMVHRSCLMGDILHRVVDFSLRVWYANVSYPLVVSWLHVGRLSNDLMCLLGKKLLIKLFWNLNVFANFLGHSWLVVGDLWLLMMNRLGWDFDVSDLWLWLGVSDWLPGHLNVSCLWLSHSRIVRLRLDVVRLLHDVSWACFSGNETLINVSRLTGIYWCWNVRVGNLRCSVVP